MLSGWSSREGGREIQVEEGRERRSGGLFGNQGKGHRERPSEVEVTHKNQNS